MEFGEVRCGGCDNVLGYFPVDNKPKEIELYCSDCKDKIDEQEKTDKVR